MIYRLQRAFNNRQAMILTLLSYGIALNGLAIIASPIVTTVLEHHAEHFYAIHLRFGIETIFGLTLLYLSSLLRRGKRTAWAVTLVLYAYIVAVSLTHPVWTFGAAGWHLWLTAASHIVAPAAVLVVLIYCRRRFTVRSDIRSFALTLRFALAALGIIFIYGVAGFILMDQRGFHHEIGFAEAAHRTLDQFGLTTDSDLIPYTRRARAFMDSLSLLSLSSLGYVFLSLFQPIRARLVSQEPRRQQLQQLLKSYPASSEDFFKLWPHDKLYFFNDQQTAGLAYGVQSGIALVLGDPNGDARAFNALLDSFDAYCRLNDWRPAFIHCESKYADLYKRHGLSLQKIGEEAVVDIPHFVKATARNKYFRQISNRFSKQGFTTEMLTPPHSEERMQELAAISRQWLNRPGRSERRFMMGNFTPEYMQQCPIMVLRDAAGTTQAFINQIPSFDPKEANFDLLRQSDTAPGNSNDFVLLRFIETLHVQGYARINLGLCPLAGLTEEGTDDHSAITSALGFLYARGDRFYSFSGLRRFKAKYEPRWSARFIAYPGGLRAFAKVATALNKMLKV